jgi:hypothetical protein
MDASSATSRQFHAHQSKYYIMLADFELVDRITFAISFETSYDPHSFSNRNYSAPETD